MADEITSPEPIKLAQDDLMILEAIFSKSSNIQMPAGAAENILHIRKWIEEQKKIYGK